MRNTAILTAAAMMLSTGMVSAAVPPSINAQGILRLTAGGLESGTFAMQFRLYANPTDTTAVYVERHPSVQVESGVFSVKVGSVTALDPNLFTQNPALWLGVTVEGDPDGELPRIALSTSPYAFQAHHADNATTADDADLLDGVDATALQRVLTPAAPLDITNNRLSIITSGCFANDVLQYNGTRWTCAPAPTTGGTLTGVTVITGGGLSGGGNTGNVSVGLLTCTADQILKFGAGGWACATDVDSGGDVTEVTTGAGSGLSGGVNTGPASLSLMTCGNGQILKFTTAGGWACAADLDSGDITAVTTSGRSGLTGGVNAGAAALSIMTCPDGQLLKFTTAGGWGCSADVDSGGDITSVSTAVGSGLSGGVTTGPAALSLVTCSNGQLLKFTTGTGWGCAADLDSGDIVGVTTAAGSGLTGGVTTGTAALTLMTCPDGQLLKFTTADGWGCAADVDSGGDMVGVTTATGGGLIGGATSGTADLSLMTCADGELLMFTTLNGWECALPADNGADITEVTTALGSGLSGGVTTGAAALSLLTCADGEFLRFDLVNGWECTFDSSGFTVAPGSGLVVTAGELSVDFGTNGTSTLVARDDHNHAADYADLTTFDNFVAAVASDTGTLNTATNPLDWSQLKNVPAGFADGADADTKYTAGAGIDISGANAISALLATPTGGDVGTSDSVARADHLHDARYTLGTDHAAFVSELADDTGTVNTPANPVDWTQLKNVPATVINGGTPYTAGAGLDLSVANVFSVEPGGIQLSMMANDSVDGQKIADSSISTNDVASINITKIANGASLTADQSFSGLNTFANAGGIVVDSDTGTNLSIRENKLSTNSTAAETLSIANDGTGVMKLQLEASNADNASLNIPAGVAPTAPSNGDVWYDSTEASLTARISNVSQRLVGVAFVQTSVQGGDTVGNTGTRTDFATQYTVPANALTAGKVIRVTFGGRLANDSTGDDLMVTIKLGGTSVVTYTFDDLNDTGGRGFYGNATLVVTAAGASGTVEGKGDMVIHGTTTRPGRIAADGANATVATDTTGDQVLKVDARWVSGADSSDTITMRQLIVEYLN